MVPGEPSHPFTTFGVRSNTDCAGVIAGARNTNAAAVPIAPNRMAMVFPASELNRSFERASAQEVGQADKSTAKPFCSFVIALLFLFTACGDTSPARDARDAPAAQADSASQSTAPPGTAPSSRPDSGWTIGTLTSKERATAPGLLRAVRAARHDGFDRIVLEFENLVPGYHIEYIDRPVRTCGSGETVPLRGDAWLEVRREPANAHSSPGQSTVQDGHV